MKKIVDWINKHKILTVIITFFLLVIQPIIVQWMFKTKAVSPFWEKTWDAGDLLTYIAGFETFIGTVFLGVVAVRQNDKANELNEIMVKNEEKRDAFERQPVLKTSNYSAEVLTGGDIFKKAYDDQYSIYLDIRNFGAIFVEKSGQFLMLSFCLVYSAKSPMKFRLNEVVLLDDNNQALSSHKNLTSINNQMIVNSLFLPNDINQFNCVLPIDALKNQTKCSIVVKISFTSNIDERFDFSIVLYLIKMFEDQWRLIFIDTNKIQAN